MLKNKVHIGKRKALCEDDSLLEGEEWHSKLRVLLYSNKTKQPYISKKQHIKIFLASRTSNKNKKKI
jgi:hypothetical protein